MALKDSSADKADVMQVKVDPGICGFTCLVEARKTKDRKISMKINYCRKPSIRRRMALKSGNYMTESMMTTLHNRRLILLYVNI